MQGILKIWTGLSAALALAVRSKNYSIRSVVLSQIDSLTGDPLRGV